MDGHREQAQLDFTRHPGEFSQVLDGLGVGEDLVGVSLVHEASLRQGPAVALSPNAPDHSEEGAPSR